MTPQYLAETLANKKTLVPRFGSKAEISGCVPLYPRNRTLTPTRQLFLCNLFYSHYSVFAFGGK